MALEAVVCPQDPFTSYIFDDFSTVGGGAYPGGSYDFYFQNEDKAFLGNFVNSANWDSSSTNSIMQHAKDQWDHYSSPKTCTVDQSLPAARIIFPPSSEPPASTTTNNRRKRRRTRISKNKEELENQRMTHITVERNRRKQMNEYLSVLKSLTPSSYVQRGDQASIIGGAIDFVKELEKQLHSMEAHKRTTTQQHQQPEQNGCHSSPFADFFTFPQFTATVESMEEIEVTTEETHANVKILSKKRPRQLLKLVAGLQDLRLTILHLNVTTMNEMGLYSISLRVAEGCHLNTVDEIAAAVNQMLRRIQEEAAF